MISARRNPNLYKPGFCLRIYGGNFVSLHLNYFKSEERKLR